MSTRLRFPTWSGPTTHRRHRNVPAPLPIDRVAAINERRRSLQPSVGEARHELTAAPVARGQGEGLRERIMVVRQQFRSRDSSCTVHDLGRQPTVSIGPRSDGRHGGDGGVSRPPRRKWTKDPRGFRSESRGSTPYRALDRFAARHRAAPERVADHQAALALFAEKKARSLTSTTSGPRTDDARSSIHCRAAPSGVIRCTRGSRDRTRAAGDISDHQARHQPSRTAYA